MNESNPVFAILNGLLAAFWRAYAQHQTHIALTEDGVSRVSLA